MGILSYIIAIVVLLGILKILALPFKIIVKFIANSIIAGILLGVLAYFGIIVVLNWWVIILTGLFGIPGLIVALLISMII